MSLSQPKTLFVAALLSLAAVPAIAHHSGAMFDDKKEVTLTGVVREFQYTNPHSWLLVDVTGNDGKVTTWGFEAEGPSSLTRAGIRLKDFDARNRHYDHGTSNERWPAGGHVDPGDPGQGQAAVCSRVRLRRPLIRGRHRDGLAGAARAQRRRDLGT